MNPVRRFQEESLEEKESPLVSSSSVRGNDEEECKGVENQNVLSRLAIYPVSDMQRFEVPDSMVPWEVDIITKFKFLVMQIINRM